MHYFIELLKGKGGWYWRLKSENGRIILVSESYHSKWNARRSARKIAGLNQLDINVL